MALRPLARQLAPTMQHVGKGRAAVPPSRQGNSIPLKSDAAPNLFEASMYQLKAKLQKTPVVLRGASTLR